MLKENSKSNREIAVAPQDSNLVCSAHRLTVSFTTLLWSHQSPSSPLHWLWHCSATALTWRWHAAEMAVSNRNSNILWNKWFNPLSGQTSTPHTSLVVWNSYALTIQQGIKSVICLNKNILLPPDTKQTPFLVGSVMQKWLEVLEVIIYANGYSFRVLAILITRGEQNSRFTSNNFPSY